MRQLVPPQQLWTEFQGDLEFEYDHSTYWPALLSLCEEKHKEKHERWVSAGKHYGESEVYMKGGDVPSLYPVTAPTETAIPIETEEHNTSAEMEEKSKVEAPRQTSGTQENGNIDVLAAKEFDFGV